MAAGARPEDIAAAFTSLIDNEVETVNNFYMERIEEGVIILHQLHQHVESIQAGSARAELRTACQRSLVQLHFQLLVLQNYVALNFTAVTKILKKFEKKFQVTHQSRARVARALERPDDHATHGSCTRLLPYAIAFRSCTTTSTCLHCTIRSHLTFANAGLGAK